jgi:uncharacterized protein YcnI
MRTTALTGLRAAGWLGASGAVVLLARTIVYSFAPSPDSFGLATATGRPPLALALAACLLGLGSSVAMTATAAVAIAERQRLEPHAIVPSPGIRPLRIVGQAVALFVVSSVAFALLESYLHWRAGLGWHGLRCLTGPVHRDAVPFLAALSLVAAAVVSAVAHVVGWVRRVIGRLLPQMRGVVERTANRIAPDRGVVPSVRESVGSVGARAPPRVLRVLSATFLADEWKRDEESSHMQLTMKSRLLVVALMATAGLIVVSGAFAHAVISPPVAKSIAGQVFTLAVPTEEEDATTTTIELTPPEGFAIDSFAPSLGWKRSVQQTGEGEDAIIQSVTWSGGSVPTEEDAVFQFVGSPDSAKTYTFDVRQTYSNGKVVDWNGPESSDTPAPTLEAKDSIGTSSSLPTIIAIVLGAIGVILGLVALFAGRRALA